MANHSTVYTMVCRTCGVHFDTTKPRVNCAACSSNGKAAAAAHTLIEDYEVSGAIITADTIKRAAVVAGCSVGGLHQALHRFGYNAVTIWRRPIMKGGDRHEA